MSAAEINDEAAFVAVRTDDMNVTAAVVRLRPEAELSPRGQAALKYVQGGMAVFQCHTIESDRECSCGRVQCPSAGKHPRNNGWEAEATADAVTIRQLWAENDANIGVPCGERNNLLVLDVDGEVGMDTLRELELEHGELPETPIVHTPNGLHYYFKHENGLNNAVRLTPGLDIRTTGGFVVGAGSSNRAGEYVWDVAYTLSDAIEPAKAPGWLLDLIRSKAGAAKGGEAIGSLEGRPDPIGFSRLLSSESKGGRRVLKQSSLRSLMPSVGKHTTTWKPPRYRRATLNGGL